MSWSYPEHIACSGKIFSVNLRIPSWNIKNKNKAHNAVIIWPDTDHTTINIPKSVISQAKPCENVKIKLATWKLHIYCSFGMHLFLIIFFPFAFLSDSKR